MKLTSLDFTDKDTVKQFIQEHDIRDIAQLNTLLRQISGVFIEQLLESERDEHLGYERYQKTPEPKTNARNGYSKKRVRATQGEMDLDIPAKPKACVAFCRDRTGTFEPMVVKKHQRDISELEDKVISMYAKGMTTRDIQAKLRRSMRCRKPTRLRAQACHCAKGIAGIKSLDSPDCQS